MSRRGPSRKQRIADLISMIEHGPSFGSVPTPNMTREQAAKYYALWAQSFVLGDLRELLRVKPESAHRLTCQHCGALIHCNVLHACGVSTNPGATS